MKKNLDQIEFWAEFTKHSNVLENFENVKSAILKNSAMEIFYLLFSNKINLDFANDDVKQEIIKLFNTEEFQQEIRKNNHIRRIKYIDDIIKKVESMKKTPIKKGKLFNKFSEDYKSMNDIDKLNFLLKFTVSAPLNFSQNDNMDLPIFIDNDTQEKVNKNFKNTRRRDIDILKYILKTIGSTYANLNSKFNDLLVSDYIMMHRSILDEMIENNQDDGNALYYLNGIEGNFIYVNSKNFFSINDMKDNDLIAEKAEFDIWLAGFNSRLNSIQEEDIKEKMREELTNRREKLLEKLNPYVNKIINYDKFEMIDLLPSRKNYSNQFIENAGDLAIPVQINGINEIDNDLIRTFFSEKIIGPENRFDIGYIIPGEKIKLKDNSLNLNDGFNNSGNSYVVILYREMAIIFNIEKITSFIKEYFKNPEGHKNSRRKVHNTFSNAVYGIKDPIIGEDFMNMAYNMINNENRNIYDVLIEKTPNRVKKAAIKALEESSNNESKNES